MIANTPLMRYKLVFSQAPANTAKPCIWTNVSCDVPIYSSSPPTEGGLRLSRPGCLVLRRGGLPVLR